MNDYIHYLKFLNGGQHSPFHWMKNDPLKLRGSFSIAQDNHLKGREGCSWRKARDN